MKKLIIAALFVLLTLAAFGCAAKDEVSQKTSSKQPAETVVKEFQPNLGGIKIGDKAQDVLDNYRSKYIEPNSNQGDGKLIGWFLINDQKELIIFDFDKDESWGNVSIKPDAKVERIRLTNFKYMD